MRTAACLIAVGLPALAPAQTSYKIAATDSVSVSRSAPHVFKDNRIRAFRQTRVGLSVCGAYKFDLSAIPKDYRVDSVKLTVTLENAFGNPSNSPIVDVRHSSGTTWTRATASPAKIPLGTVVAKGVGGFALPTHTFELDVTAHDFSSDVAAGVLTLVLENVKTTASSYVYFFGHAGSPQGPNARLDVVARPCRGELEAFGTGGRDSWNTPHTLAGTGCPEPGNEIVLTTQVNRLLKGPLLLWIGASDEKWGALQLPFDLGPFGATGNSIYTSLDIGPIALKNEAGRGSITVRLAENASLKGVTFFAQAVLWDPLANDLTLVMSNGLSVRIR